MGGSGRLRRALVPGAIALTVAACGSSSVDDAPPDAGSGDAVSADVLGDAPVVYGDLAAASAWSFFETSKANVNALGFRGGAFDGRYVYFANNNHGVYDGMAMRYDTRAELAEPTSWRAFNTTDLDKKAKDFAGATFDGRYLYFVPNGNAAPNGVVARYDTKARYFDDLLAWSIFDTTTIAKGAKGFVGATFDGRYVYLVPNGNGVVVRFDTFQRFGVSNSWSTFDTTTVDANAKGFVGAATDGRYVYFVPSNNGVPDGVVARLDARASFTAASSWSTFDTTTVDANAKGFHGAAFDGRFLYLVPHDNGAPDGVVARYDTQASFSAASSWSAFDATRVHAGAKGFQGAGFDGRYVYFVPGLGGVVTRHDTRAAFTEPSSWSSFDTASAFANARNYEGAVFDGRYLYLVPTNVGVSGGAVARFDARTPPWVPEVAGHYGSFF